MTDENRLLKRLRNSTVRNVKDANGNTIALESADGKLRLSTTSEVMQPGPQGNPGPQGAPGKDGVNGTPGRDGINGKYVRLRTSQVSGAPTFASRQGQEVLI